MKVKVVLEIKTGVVWADDCTAKQLKKQSLDNVGLILSKIFKHQEDFIRIVSKPKCISIEYIDDEEAEKILEEGN